MDLTKELRKDRKVIVKGLAEFGVLEHQIKILEDQQSKDLVKLCKGLLAEVKNRWEQKRMYTVIYFHYGGHGIIVGGKLFAVCNSNVKSKLKWAMEDMMRALARQPGAFVIAIFDCCREQIPEKMRGGADQIVQTVDELEDEKGSLIMLFACEAGKRASAVSSVADQFFG